jgi:hypothetical protein
VVVRKSRIRRELKSLCVEITLGDLLLDIVPPKVLSLPPIPFVVGVLWWCGARKELEVLRDAITLDDDDSEVAAAQLQLHIPDTLWAQAVAAGLTWIVGQESVTSARIVDLILSKTGV